MDINNMTSDETEIAKNTVTLLAHRVGELEAARAELIARLGAAQTQLAAAEKRASFVESTSLSI